MQSAIIYTDWCYHEARPAPSLDEHDSFRRLWFRNFMNCIRFEIDHYLTWDWPNKDKEIRGSRSTHNSSTP